MLENDASNFLMRKEIAQLQKNQQGAVFPQWYLVIILHYKITLGILFNCLLISQFFNNSLTIL